MPKPQGFQKKKIEEKKNSAASPGKVMQTKKEKKDSHEDMTNFGNLINAVRIVESSTNPKINKKIRGKSLTKGKEQQGKPMRQAPVKPKKNPVQTAPVRRDESDLESSADESDFDNRTEIADLKKSVSAMMAKIEKLETEGNRKRRKKRKIPTEDHASDSSLNSDREQHQKLNKSKPEKIVKKEKEVIPPTSAIRNREMHTPMTNIPQMNNVFQQFMPPGIYSPMMHPNITPSLINMFPMMAAMMPQQGVPSIYQQNLPLQTKIVNESTTTTTKHSIENQEKEHDSNVNSSTESKKSQKKSKAVTFNSEKDKDGNESDVSEVFGPTGVKEPNDFHMKYLGSDPIATPSFIKFVDEMTKDTETVQSTVISSTRKNTDNTSNVKTTVEGESNKLEQTINANLYKRSNSLNSKQPIGNTSNVAGILLNLFPQKSGANGENNNSLRQGLDGLEQPEIDNAVRTMFRKKSEHPPAQYHQQHQHHQLTEPVSTVTDIKTRKPIQATPSYDNKYNSFPVLRKKSEAPKRRYNDNKVWFRDCPNKLHLQDQDGDT